MIPAAALTLADHALGLGEAIVQRIPLPSPEHRRAVQIATAKGRLAVVRLRVDLRVQHGRPVSIALTRREARLKDYIARREKEAP